MRACEGQGKAGSADFLAFMWSGLGFGLWALLRASGLDLSPGLLRRSRTCQNWSRSPDLVVGGLGARRATHGRNSFVLSSLGLDC